MLRKLKIRRKWLKISEKHIKIPEKVKNCLTNYDQTLLENIYYTEIKHWIEILFTNVKE